MTSELHFGTSLCNFTSGPHFTSCPHFTLRLHFTLGLQLWNLTFNFCSSKHGQKHVTIDQAMSTVAVCNIVAAFEVLKLHISNALLIQLGDAARLGEERWSCTALLNQINMVRAFYYICILLMCFKHRAFIDIQHYTTMVTSVMCMIEHIDHAVTMLTDLLDEPPPIFDESIQTGQWGRPRKNIDPAQLASLSVRWTKHIVVAEKFGCCACTIKHQLVEYGYSVSGPPDYRWNFWTYHPGTCSDLSNLTDLELDQLLLDIHTQFPSFGCWLLDGCLLQMGHWVPKQRLKLSYLHVVGPSDCQFGPHHLYQHVYSVAGPNSLWHHDGQHGKWYLFHLLYSFNIGSLENIHSWIHQWQYQICCWYEGPQQ